MSCSTSEHLGGPGKGGAEATCLLGPPSVPRYISCQLPWSGGDSLCFWVPYGALNKGSLTYFKTQGKKGGDGKGGSNNGEGQPEVPRGREEGHRPGHLGAESGQSGLVLHLSPPVARAFLDCFAPKRGQQARSLTVRTSALGSLG